MAAQKNRGGAQIKLKPGVEDEYEKRHDEKKIQNFNKEIMR
jgi:L-rhamnose mutarotase